MYVDKNTYQDASVEFVRSIRTNSARSRLQKTGGKPRRGFSTRSNGCALRHTRLFIFSVATIAGDSLADKGCGAVCVLIDVLPEPLIGNIHLP